MFKLAGVLVFAAVLAFASSSVVLPPTCSDGNGGGDSIGIFTYVTNLTLALTELTQLQPYNLTAGATYNVTFAFIPTSDTQVQVFKVVAEFTVNGVPQQTEIASTSVGPYQAPSVATILNFCPLLFKLKLQLACLVSNLLNLSLLELVTCAGDALVQELVTYVPSQAAATVIMTVPEGAMDTAVFRGIVGDNNGKVVACREGSVLILGN